MNRTREFSTFCAGALFATAMHIAGNRCVSTMPVELRDACQVADWHQIVRMK